MIYSILFVVATATGPLAGNLGDRLSPTRVSVAALTVGVLGLVIILLTSTLPLLIGGVVVLAAGFRSFPPVIQSHLLNKMAHDSTGGDFGALKSVYTGLGSLGATYVGVVADATNYLVAFWGFVPIAIVATLIVFRYLTE